MAEIKFNAGQLDAIQARGTNILVSAAAGSGKTTVLVERVIRKIINDGVDIDSLVIMTFTKAAAANMKAKIYKSIKDALERDDLGEDKKNNLRIQMMKIYNANISTIDSLCMRIVKENFQEIDIDPAFRIADEAEMNLIKKDVLARVIERNYQNPTQGFMDFVNYYIDKNDSKIEDIIRNLYTYSQSHQEPLRWLNTCAGTYVHAGNYTPDQDENENLWHGELKKIFTEKIENLNQICEKAIEICDKNDGPYFYKDKIVDVKDKLSKLEGAYDEIGDGLEDIIDGWESLSSPRNADVDSDLRTQAKDMYGDIKKKATKLKNDFFAKSFLGMYEDIGKCASVATAIVDLTKEFYFEFLKEKKDRLIADFNDVAHYALKVLIKHTTLENGDEYILRDENGNVCFSLIADKMSQSIDEIIVDEYQDTNHLQDALIEALSANRFGRPNVFMVGDVKQSIYGFRMACPELFNQKRDAYENGNGGKLIFLDENHRSRKEVLDLTNFVFEQAMIREIGGIDYTKNNELKLGGSFEDKDDLHILPEIIMVNGSGKDAKLASAYIVAKKIEELVLSGLNYSDIAILSRTTNQPLLEQVLGDRKIPTISSSNKGFFETFEVKLAINLFRIIDNPYQDIPMCAVLMSPIVGVDANELAKIKNNFDGKNFSVYEALKAADKYSWFINKLNEYHEKSLWMDIEELIEDILEGSGLYNIVSAMPKGNSRKANLDYIKNICATYAKGSYVGLYNFVRYFDELIKAEYDFGLAQSDSAFDAVQIMTIHKSKGLEFKVCIVFDAGYSSSGGDPRKKPPISLDRELGMGIEVRDVDEKNKCKTLLMNVIDQKKKTDERAEELRLLYVAMTRAIDKLIIVGDDKTINSKSVIWNNEKGTRAKPLSPAEILDCNSYIDVLGRTLSHDGKRANKEVPRFNWEIRSCEDIEIERVDELLEDAEKRNEIEEKIRADIEPAKILVEYAFEDATKTQIKVTASQLEEKTNREFDLDSKNFKPKKGLGGAQRGNAYHKLFEKFDFEKSVQDNIKLLLEDRFLTEEQVQSINIDDIEKFANSSLGQRMKKADSEGNLRREQQFVARYIDGSENRLIQGIIDAFFEENGEIVLVDYKTDKNKDENYFIETYKPQQDAYAMTIEKATNKKVKEKILYSTELGKEIVL